MNSKVVSILCVIWVFFVLIFLPSLSKADEQFQVNPLLIKKAMDPPPIKIQPKDKIQIPKKLEDVKFPPLATANDALLLAVMDMRTIDPFHHQYLRYIWIDSGEYEDAQATILAINKVSRSSVIVKPVILGKDKLILLRLDLRQLAPREEDLREYTKIYEEFQFDPCFSVLITKDTLKFVLGIGIGVDPNKDRKTIKKQRDKVVVQEAPPVIKGKDGKDIKDVKESKAPGFTTQKEEYEEVVGRGEDVDRIVSPHLNLDLVAELVQNTTSQAPIISYSYFLTRSLTTVEDKGVFRTIYGGLYYKLNGIKASTIKDATDEDVFFESLNVGNIKEKISAKQIFDKLRSDARIAIFRSNVTGRPRRVDIFRTSAGHVTADQSIISVTHDLKRQSIDIGTHPLMNLIEFRDDAREVIYERANSLLGYVLFNGAGKLQVSVPDDIASDHTIPIPNGSVLQPAIGCIRCHKGDGGWQILTNDVEKLLGDKFDVFDDLTKAKKQSQSDVIDRLVGLYSGKPEIKLLPRARDDYASGILRATDTWKESKQNQTDIVRIASDRISGIFKRYNYDLVTTQVVLRDLGIEYSSDKKAVELLDRLLPPVPDIIIGGILQEDPRILALKLGIPIVRTDYDLISSPVKIRASKTLLEIQQNLKDKK